MAEQITAQPLPVEQVMGQLKTRGFESGGFRSPLRDFWGTLTGITGAMVQRGQMQQARLEVSYNFDGVEVMESTEPYPFPIAQISVMHNNRAQSAMGVLGKSIDTIINAGVDENAPQEQVKNQDSLIGKRQHWKVTGGHMMYDVEKKQETPRDCWELVEVEGMASAPTSKAVAGAASTPTITPSKAETPTQRAMSLLDNRTLQQWNNEVFKDTVVKAGGGDLINTIIQGTFVSTLEASGLVTKDANGVYHIKK